jgi:hypothetical protein
VDGNGSRLELEPIIQNLLALQQNPSTFFSIRRHVLNALLGMVSAPDGQIVRTIAREVNAISVLIQKYANLLLNCYVSFQRGVLRRSQDFY